MTEPHRMLTRVGGGRRGVVMLWFLLVILPLVLLGASLAVDLTRSIAAARHMSNTTEAAALAGAQQFENSQSTRLDPTAAAQASRHLMDLAEAETNMDSVIDDVTVTVSDDARRVTVQVEYRVEDLVFLPAMLAIFGDNSVSSTLDLTMTRSADVCIPGQYSPTGGVCVGPQSSDR